MSARKFPPLAFASRIAQCFRGRRHDLRLANRPTVVELRRRRRIGVPPVLSHRRRAFFEPLEDRLLLTGITAYVSGGQLVVGGTAQNDTIVIDQLGAAGSEVRVLDSGNVAFTAASAAVSSVYVAGWEGDDSITIDATLGALSTQLYGNTGSDTLIGGAGNDWLVADADDTQLIGGPGSDSLDFSPENRPINFTNTQATSFEALYGGSGDDTLDSSASTTTVFLSGNAGDDVLTGGIGNDYLNGDAGNDALHGNAGDDQCLGGLGSDTFGGDAGNDWLIADAADTEILGGDGSDSFSFTAETAGVTFTNNGTTAFEAIYGGSGNDTIDCSAITTPMTIAGGAGDDILIGGSGNDSLDGGLGNDTLIGGDGADYLVGGLGADSLTGDNGDDYLIADAADTSLTGGSGSDSLNFAAETNDVNFLNTSAAAFEAIYGGSGNDTLDSSPSTANLIVSGGAGNDLLIGGSGNDYLIGNSGDDVLGGLAGDDTLVGSDGADSIDGGVANDWLIADSFDPSLIGGDDNDSADFSLETNDIYFTNTPLAAFEALYGGSGNDYFDSSTGTAPIIILGGAGDDWLIGGSGDDHLEGGRGNDVLLGYDGSDYLTGGDDNDTLGGYAAGDTLLGNEGDDALYGGVGTDVLDGGPGDNLEDPAHNPPNELTDLVPFSVLVPTTVSADTHQAAIGAALWSRFSSSYLQDLEGRQVTFTIDGGTQATLTAPIHNGSAAVVFDTSTIAGTLYNVTASVDSFTATTAFSVVSGSPYSIDLSPSKTELVADTKDSLTVEATIRDQWDNPVADGTQFAWFSENGANVFTTYPGDTIATEISGIAFFNQSNVGGTTVNGTAEITVRAPIASTEAGSQEPFTINIDSGDATASLTINVVPVTVELTGPSDIPRGPGQTYTDFYLTTNAPDGTPVYWTTSKGYLGTTVSTSTITNGASHTVLTIYRFSNLGEFALTATVGSAMAVKTVTLSPSTPHYIEIDHPVIAGDATENGSDMISVPTDEPLIDAESGQPFGGVNPSVIRSASYSYYAESTLTIHGYPNMAYYVRTNDIYGISIPENLIEMRNATTGQLLPYYLGNIQLYGPVETSSSGIAQVLVRSLGSMTTGGTYEHQAVFLTALDSTAGGGGTDPETAKLDIVEHNWWTRTQDGVLSFLGGDPQTVVGVGANIAGGMLVVGDAGSLVKNGWRAMGFSNKPVNYAEVALSGLGIATELAVGVGEAADAPISGVRAIVAALGKTKFTDALVILLKRALTNGQDLVKFGKYVAKITTSEAAYQIAQKLFTSEEAMQAGIRAVDEFGDKVFTALKNVGQDLPQSSIKAAERLNRILGNVTGYVNTALKDLSTEEFKTATAYLGKLFYGNKVDPERVLGVLNTLPNGILTQQYRITDLLKDMADLVDDDVPGLNTLFSRIATSAYAFKRGWLYEMKVAAFIKREFGATIDFIDEFVPAAEGLSKTDIDVVAGGVYYQAKSSENSFLYWKGRPTNEEGAVSAAKEWVDKVRAHGIRVGNPNPTIKYVVPERSMVPSKVMEFFDEEGIEIIEVAFPTGT